MAASGVTLITATGGRPQAFELCCKFVDDQTYRGPLQWITVDDVSPFSPFTESPRPNARLDAITTVILPHPKWENSQNTLARNIRAALPEIQYDKILFIEDDDWYSPRYIDTQLERMEGREMVGEQFSIYYHLPTKRYRMMQNRFHASLCQTGIRFSLLTLLDQICSQSDFIDFRLWDSVPVESKFLHGRLPLNCIGMKGLPGRKGIGVGHHPDTTAGNWSKDPDMTVLEAWIGKDVELYRRLM